MLFPKTVMTACCVRPAQGRSHEVGRWHEAIGILVMFIHAEPIKTALLRKFQLIQELVVQSVHFLRIIELRGHIDPHAAILLFKILR